MKIIKSGLCIFFIGAGLFSSPERCDFRSISFTDRCEKNAAEHTNASCEKVIRDIFCARLNKRQCICQEEVHVPTAVAEILASLAMVLYFNYRLDRIIMQLPIAPMDGHAHEAPAPFADFLQRFGGAFGG